MRRIRITSLALVTCFLLATLIHGQEDIPYRMLSFDDKGKMEDVANWAAISVELKLRSPDYVFVLVHGWRKSRDRADETYAALAKLLIKHQTKDESIAIIGVRWPSLIGETDSVADQDFKNVAKMLTAALAKSGTLKEKQSKLKEFLKKPTTRMLASASLKFSLPDDDQLDAMIDQLQELENVEKLLTSFSYYTMKNRANLVGSTGLADALDRLQTQLPKSQFHLVGHSFGCKVCLACLASNNWKSPPIHSLTLLQGAVSNLCFAPSIKAIENTPAGAYADVPNRVKGAISVTYTHNDKALTLAYAMASQIAGQVGELTGRRMQMKPELYAALGANGIANVPDIPRHIMGESGTVYDLKSGLNALDATAIIQSHGDIRRDEVAWLIWATARHERR